MKQCRFYLYYLLPIFLMFIMSGCAEFPKEMEVPLEHIIMFDGSGKPLNPKGNLGEITSVNKTEAKAKNLHFSSILFNYDGEDDRTYKEQHIERIKNEMTEFFEKKPTKRLLIFIHGGLNSQVDSLERIVGCIKDENKPLYEKIKDNGYYPIFINWKSSLLSSYAEHLISLRQGETHEYYGLLTSPVVFAADVSRGSSRWLTVSGNLLTNDIQTIPRNRNEIVDDSDADDSNKADKVAKQLLCLKYNEVKEKDYSKAISCINDKVNDKERVQFGVAPRFWKFEYQNIKGHRPEKEANNTNLFPVVIGDDKRELLEMTENFSTWTVTYPFKLLSAPVIDAFGSSAWDVMLRRTDLLFHPEDESTSLIPTDDDLKGLPYFFDSLEKTIGKEKNWEITLVGHSMGTIVANKIIKEFGDKLPIKKIVYLASADTIQNYEEAVYPYLKSHENTDIYHFVLHPVAEESEQFWYLPPRGSLLVWIDNFLSKPLSSKQRTAGRYDNLLPNLHNAPDKIRGRIHLRVFSAGDSAEDKNPQTHSDVAGRFKFWDDTCLESSEKEGCVIKEKSSVDNCVTQ